jgi:hypothetical protein
LKSIIEIAKAFSVDQYRDFARSMLESRYERGRLIAAYVLIAVGEEQPACEHLERQLKSNSYLYSRDDSVALVEMLADSKLKSASKLLDLFISSKRLDNVYDRSDAGSVRTAVVAPLYKSPARNSLLRYYVGHLDDKRPDKHSIWPNDRVCDRFARELLKGLHEVEPKINELQEKKGDDKDKISDLKVWIEKQLKEK